MEKEGKAHLFPLSQGKDHLGLLPVKQPLLQGGLIRHHFLQQVFIVGQLPDKVQNQRGILPLGKAKCHIRAQKPLAPLSI